MLLSQICNKSKKKKVPEPKQTTNMVQGKTSVKPNIKSSGKKRSMALTNKAVFIPKNRIIRMEYKLKPMAQKDSKERLMVMLKSEKA